MSKKNEEVPEVIQVAPLAVLDPVKACNMIAPTFGVHMDADMAVSYVTSTRRSQLRKAKAEAEKKRKEIHGQLTRLNEIIVKEIAPSSKGVESDWVATLNSVFKSTKVNFVAYVRLPSSVDRLDTNGCFNVSKMIVTGDPSKANELVHTNYGQLFTDAVLVKASDIMVQAFTDISKCQSDISRVADIELLIQKEINELQFSAESTKASLFAATMRSDSNGKAILATLDARLNDYPQIPALPLGLGVVVK